MDWSQVLVAVITAGGTVASAWLAYRAHRSERRDWDDWE